MPHVNKNHKREMEMRFKQKTRPRMNYEWIGKQFKESDPKKQKNSKNQSEIGRM